MVFIDTKTILILVILMITKNFKCTRCKSENIIKNGKDAKRHQQFHCKDCGKYGNLAPNPRYTEEDKEKIINAYYERSSMRGISRIFGIDRKTLSAWLKKKQKSSQS